MTKRRSSPFRVTLALSTLVFCLASACSTMGFGTDAAPATSPAPSVDAARTTELARQRVNAGFDDFGLATAIGGEPSGDPKGPPQLSTPARKMVYSASLGIEVARVDENVAKCMALVTEMGGYVSQRHNASLTCRVPATRFQELVDAVRSYGRILQQSTNAQDVTKQHRDLTIRLENAKRSRERLLALLDKAERVEDLLKIESQLRRLTEEIEQMTGELKYLDDQIALSTVTVTFQPIAAPDRPGRLKRSRFPWINLVGVEHVTRWF